jgi:hypothetical protein
MSTLLPFGRSSPSCICKHRVCVGAKAVRWQEELHTCCCLREPRSPARTSSMHDATLRAAVAVRCVRVGTPPHAPASACRPPASPSRRAGAASWPHTAASKQGAHAHPVLVRRAPAVLALRSMLTRVAPEARPKYPTYSEAISWHPSALHSGARGRQARVRAHTSRRHHHHHRRLTCLKSASCSAY